MRELWIIAGIAVPLLSGLFAPLWWLPMGILIGAACIYSYFEVPSTGTEIMSTIAERLFDGTFAQHEVEEIIFEAGIEWERTGWDHYDCSLELHGVAPDTRLSHDVQIALKDAGFAKVYVNHTDKWETHYSLSKGVSDGWRVSYPHKRGADEKGIWVEKVVEGWPKDWLDTAYVIVKPPISVSEGLKR